MSAQTPQIMLAHHLKALRLPTFLREYDKLARQCATEGVDHTRYLQRLAELELIDRERQLFSRSSALTSRRYSSASAFGRTGGSRPRS